MDSKDFFRVTYGVIVFQNISLEDLSWLISFIFFIVLGFQDMSFVPGFVNFL